MAEDNDELKDAVFDQALSQIWFQIETAATNAKCAKIYRDKIARNNRNLDYILLLILVLGIIWTAISDNSYSKWIAVGTSSLTVITSIFKNLIPAFRRGNDDIIELDKIAEFYEKYLVDCVHIFSDLYANNITPKEARDRLYEHEIKAASFSVVLNKLVWSTKRIDKKFRKEAEDNIKRRFGIKSPNNNE